jgi:hypothetical protein
MHDCVETKERLVDLVFDELEPEARRRVLVEVESCQDCLAEYRSMTETLRVFDQVVEVSAPDESYWPGYEDRLRARLSQAPLSWKRRLTDWIGSFGALAAWPARPISLAAGLAAILLAVAWWGWQRQRTATTVVNPPIARVSPTPKLESPDKESVIAPASNDVSIAPKNKKFVVPPSGGLSNGLRKPAKAGTTNTVPREERGEKLIEDDVALTGPDQSLIVAPLFTPETIKHFEKAQILLRSFRNASVPKAAAGERRGPDGSIPIDLSYEKEMSRKLLQQNVLLRRDAEMKGNLPTEEALDSLEPFLLDIANLPDNPSLGDLSGIRDRLRRKEMIASLQIASAAPSGPTFVNP